jgi:hypothetical protein
MRPPRLAPVALILTLALIATTLPALAVATDRPTVADEPPMGTGIAYLPIALRAAAPVPATAAPAATPTAPATAPPTSPPTATPTSQTTSEPTPAPTPAPFEVTLVPERIRDCLPGQRCMFLAVVEDQSADPSSAGPIHLSADIQGAAVVIEPEEVAGSLVAEVNVSPVEASVGETLTLSVHAVRGDTTRQAEALLDVNPGNPDDFPERVEQATVIRDKFIPWLAEHHPELGIDGTTEWESVVVTPTILVVMHHLFFSEEWEMEVRWHVMIPPYDWERIYLRHRFDEHQPSYAFEISSSSAGDEPIPIEPPDEIWR